MFEGKRDVGGGVAAAAIIPQRASHDAIRNRPPTCPARALFKPYTPIFSASYSSIYSLRIAKYPIVHTTHHVWSHPHLNLSQRVGCN